ncbi:MAG: RHS repeat-associated core domain-containing protein, partial [Bryobacteraceae bacterium]
RTGAVASQASVVVDRLGSVRVSKVGSTVQRLEYWPYGEEKPGATGQEREKLATYARDATGLDYADQRYYGSVSGRFLTPDPAGEGPNLYSYVRGDPANFGDPTGLRTDTEVLTHGGLFGLLLRDSRRFPHAIDVRWAWCGIFGP